VLIHDISEATKAQTNSATTVSKNMQLIQDITTETTTTTQSSAASVEQLTALAKELRYSVAGFKL
jgi:twitching motility protein PilJ